MRYLFKPVYVCFCCLILASACSKNPESHTIQLSGIVDIASVREEIQGPVFVGVLRSSDMLELKNATLDSVVDIVSVNIDHPEFIIDLSNRGLKPGDRVTIIAFADNDYDNLKGVPEPTPGDIIGFYQNADREIEYVLADGMNQGLSVQVSRRIYDFTADISGTVLGEDPGMLRIIAYSGNIDSSDFDELDFDGVIGFRELEKPAGPVSYQLDILPYGYDVPIEHVYVFCMLDVDRNGKIDAGDRIGYYAPDPDKDLPEPITIEAGSRTDVDLRFIMDVTEQAGHDIRLQGTVSLPETLSSTDAPIFILIADSDNTAAARGNSAEDIHYFKRIPEGSREFEIDLSGTSLAPGDEIMIIALLDRNYRGGFPSPDAGDVIGFYMDRDNLSASYSLNQGLNEGIDIHIGREVFDFEADISGVLTGSGTGDATIIAYAGEITSSDFSKLDLDHVIGVKALDKTDDEVAWTMDIMPYGRNLPITDVFIFAFLDANRNGKTDDGDRYGYFSTDENKQTPSPVLIQDSHTLGIDIELNRDAESPSGHEITIEGTFIPPSGFETTDFPAYVIVGVPDDDSGSIDSAMDSIKYFEKIDSWRNGFRVTLDDTNLKPGDKILLVGLWDRNFQGGFPSVDAGDYIGFYRDPENPSPLYTLSDGLNTGIAIPITRKVFDFEADISGAVMGPEKGDLTVIAYAGDITSSDFSRLDFDKVIGVRTMDKSTASVSYAMDIMPYGCDLPIRNVVVLAFLDVNRNGETDAGDRYGYYTSNASNNRPSLIDIKTEHTQAIDISLTGEVKPPSGYSMFLEGAFIPPAEYEKIDFPVYLIVAAAGENVASPDQAMNNIAYFEKLDSWRNGFRVSLEDTSLKPGDRIMLVGLWDRNSQGGFPEVDRGDYIGFYRDMENVSIFYTLSDGLNTGIEIPVTREVFDYYAEITGVISARETGIVTLIAYAGDIVSSDMTKLDFDAVIGVARIEKNGPEPVSYSMEVLPYGFNTPIRNVFLFALLDSNRNNEFDGGDKVGFYKDEDGFPQPFMVFQGVTRYMNIRDFSMNIREPENVSMSLRGTFTIPDNYSRRSPPVFLILASIDNPEDVFDNPMSAIKYFYRMPPGEFFFDVDLRNTTLAPGDNVMVIALWDRDFTCGFPRPSKNDKVGFLQNSEKYAVGTTLQHGLNAIPKEGYTFDINRLIYEFESSIMYMIDRAYVSSYNVDRASTMIVSVHVNGVKIQLVSGRVNVAIDMNYALGISVIKPPAFDSPAYRNQTVPLEKMREHQIFPAVYEEIIVWENNPPPEPLIQGVYNPDTEQDETAYLFAIIDADGDGEFDPNRDYIGYYNEAIDATNGFIVLPGGGVLQVPPGTYYVPRPINIITKGRNFDENGGPFWIDFKTFDPA